MARQGEVIPRKGSERRRRLNKWTAWTNKRIHRNLLFLPRSGIEPGTSGNSDIAMTTTPSAARLRHDVIPHHSIAYIMHSVERDGGIPYHTNLHGLWSKNPALHVFTREHEVLAGSRNDFVVVRFSVFPKLGTTHSCAVCERLKIIVRVVDILSTVVQHFVDSSRHFVDCSRHF